MNKLLTLILFFNLCISYSVSSQCQNGDTCMVVDSNCLDFSQYPVISELITAGVQGGVPDNLPVIATINNTDNIQTAIDNSTGDGVIILTAGIYPISSTIYMKSNIVLRGESAELVIIQSTIKSTREQGKKNTIEFNNVSNSGIENLTILYQVIGYEPIDKLDWLDGGWCGDCFQNDPHGLDDLYVRQVSINNSSNNCWIDSCRILKSGTDPILLAGNHNTLRNNYVDRCYNKGGSGNGYYDIRGDYNLIYNETIKRLRHFTIQQGAEYNVIIGNYIEGDVNFHNGDNGNNLLENNEIKLPTWHGWDIFGTGGAVYGHQPPGPNNIFVNNTINYKNQGPRYADANVIYTFTDYGQPDTTNWTMPICNTFYPMDMDNNLNSQTTIDSNEILIYPNPVKDKLYLKGNIILLEKEIKMYNALGQEVDFVVNNSSQNNIEIDMSNLKTGFYILKTKTNTKKIYKK